MEKTVIFSDKDKDLIEQIEAYQKEKGVSFDDAVKALCKNALTGKKDLVWGDF